jgi:hypothetical protein
MSIELQIETHRSSQSRLTGRKTSVPTCPLMSIYVLLLCGVPIGQPLKAATVETLCEAAVLDDIPRGLSEPLMLWWKDDGGLDVVGCGRDLDPKKIKLSRWATVYLPGIRTVEHNGVRKLILETQEGPISLGELSLQPCLPQSRSRGKIECSILFGEKKLRPPNPVTWHISLTLGEDAGAASEAVFFPQKKPKPISREEMDLR